MIHSRFRSLLCITALLFSLQGHALTQEEEVSYQESKKLYASKEYAKAYEILLTLYLNALDNPELNFYLGKAAFEVGEFQIAIAAFDRVAILDPNNVRNALELARTKYYVNLLPEAEEEFKKILQNPGLPENVRLNVEYYLSAIAKKQQRSFIFTTVRAGILYDSNVNFRSTDIPLYNGLPSTDKPTSDTAHEETLNVTHLYDFGAKGGMMVRNTASIYNRSYSNEHDYDVVMLSYLPALIYNDQRSSYELIGGIDQLYLGAESFSTSYSLQPKWIYTYLPSLRQTLALKVGQSNYTDNGLDSRKVEGQAALEYYLSSSSSLRGDIILSRQIKNNISRLDVSYSEISPNLLYVNQIVPKTIIQVNVGLKKRSFDDSYPDQGDRMDKTVYGSVSLIQRLSDAVSFELMGNYNHTDSTLSVYSFDKYTLSMSLSTRF